MKSKIRRYLLVGGLLGVLVAGALVLALPTLAARGLESKVKGKLEAQSDVQATWQALDVSFGGELELADLHIIDEKRGVDLRVERIYIKPTLLSMFEDEPEIKEIRVEGTTLDLDTFFLVNKIMGDKDKEEKDDPDKPKDEKKAGGMSERLKRSFKTSPPRVIIERARIMTTLEGAPVAEIELTRAELSGGGDEPLVLTSQGYMTTRYAKVPKLLRQRHSWDVKVDYDVDARQIIAEIGSGDEGEPLLDLELPRIARGKLGRVRAEIDLANLKSPRVQAQEFYLKVGGRNESDLIAMLSAKTLGMTLNEGSPVLTGRATDFEFTPSKFKELNNLRDRFKPLGGTLDKLKAKNSPVKQADTAPSSPQQSLEQVGKWLGWGRSLSNAMGKINVELEQGSITMHVPGEEDSLRAIELVSDLNVSLDEGHLMMTGVSAEGSFLSDVVFLPGQSLPHSASLVASGVNLGKLPGMDQGRTLPNRGIKGRIGGVVDLSVHLLTPPTGVMLEGGGVLDEVTLRGVLNWHEGMLDVQGVADEPLTNQELDLKGALKWYPGRGEFTLEEAEVHYNGLDTNMEGSLRGWPLVPVLRLDAHMPETPCQAMVDAMPDAMLGPYRKVKIEGSAAPSLWVKWPLHSPEHLEVELDGFAVQDTSTIRRKRKRRGMEDMFPSDKDYHCKLQKIASDRKAWPDVKFMSEPGSSGQARAKKSPPSWYGRTSQSDVYWLNQPFVKRVTEGVSKDAEVYVGPGLDTYVPLSSLPPWVGGAAYLSEEILFFENRGVSFGLIRKALRINFERGRFVYGGSTVTQQLVKNLFLTRDKTLARKLQEAIISLRIDEVVSKERVLELYLNCIEFGPNLYGIGPAAQHYFGKPASELTPMEALFLATIKPSPSYGEHLKRRGNLPPDRSWFIKRFGTLFKRMIEYEVMTQAEVDRARRQTIKWVDGVYAPEFEQEPLEDVMHNLLEDMMSP